MAEQHLDRALLEKEYKRFVYQFALGGLNEWDKLVRQTNILGDISKPDGITAKAAGVVGAGLGALAFFTTGINLIVPASMGAQTLAAEVQNIAGKTDQKRRLTKLETAAPDKTNLPQKTKELAKLFVSVGIEVGDIFQQLIAEAWRVSEGSDEMGVDRLAQDAIERGLKEFTSLTSCSNFSLTENLIYSVIYGKSKKKFVKTKMKVSEKRGRNMKAKLSFTEEAKEKLGLSVQEKLNTHKCFERARPIKAGVEDGKWISFRKKGEIYTRQITYRRIAKFEMDGEEMTQQFLDVYTDKDCGEVGDPKFQTLAQDKDAFATQILLGLNTSVPSLYQWELIDRTRNIDEGVGNIESILAHSGVSIQQRKRLFNFGAPSPIFKGRVEELTTLRTSFLNKEVEKRSILLISGLGGQGKTQLAIQFASKIENDPEFPYSSCLLLKANSGEKLIESLIRIYSLQGIRVPQFTGNNDSNIWELFATLFGKVTSLSQAVVILDNIDSANNAAETFLREFIETGGERPLFIVTSRKGTMLSGLSDFMLPSIKLQKLKDSEAEDLVRCILVTFLQKFRKEGKNISTLCRRLDNHALSLKQAASLINISSERIGGYSITQYLDEYESHLTMLKLLKFKCDEIYGLSTWAVFSVTFQNIGENARRLLRLAMFLCEETISIEELKILGESFGDQVARNFIEDANNLRDNNLIDTSDEEGLIVHTLIQDIVRIHFENELWEDAKTILSHSHYFSFSRAVESLEYIFNPEGEEGMKNYAFSIPIRTVAREVIRICKVKDEKGENLPSTKLIQEHWFSLLTITFWDKEINNITYVLTKLLPFVSLMHPLFAKVVEKLVFEKEIIEIVNDSCDFWWWESFEDSDNTFSASFPEIPEKIELYGGLKFLQSLSYICVGMFTKRVKMGEFEEAQKWWERQGNVEDEAFKLYKISYLWARKYYTAVCLYCEVGRFNEAFEIAEEMAKQRKAGENIPWQATTPESLYIARALVKTNRISDMELLFPGMDFTEILLSFLKNVFKYVESRFMRDVVTLLVKSIQDCLEIVGPVVKIDDNFEQNIDNWCKDYPNAFTKPVNVDGKFVTLSDLVELIYQMYQEFLEKL